MGPSKSPIGHHCDNEPPAMLASGFYQVRRQPNRAKPTGCPVDLFQTKSLRLRKLLLCNSRLLEIDGPDQHIRIVAPARPAPVLARALFRDRSDVDWIARATACAQLKN
jgi:hypothetical protein